MVGLAEPTDQVGQPFPGHGLAVTAGVAIVTSGVGGGVVWTVVTPTLVAGEVAWASDVHPHE